MTLTPYSISESTKISEAYLNNVLNEASVAWGDSTLKNSKHSSETPEYFKIFTSKNDISPNDVKYYMPQPPLPPPPPPKPSFWQRLKNAKGDIINAGLRTMANGSPFVIAPYENGNNKLKSSEQIQREQKENVIAAAAGVAAGAAAVNPAAAVTVGKTAGKYALNAFNAYSDVKFAKDFFDNSPDAANLAVGLAASNPKMAANIGKKLLNSRWGWVPGVGYAVIDGLVDGYNDAKNSTQPPPSDNQQTTSSDNQPTTSSADQKQTIDPHSIPNYDKLKLIDTAIGKHDYQGISLSPADTNNAVNAALEYASREQLLSPDYQKALPRLGKFFNAAENNPL